MEWLHLSSKLTYLSTSTQSKTYSKCVFFHMYFAMLQSVLVNVAKMTKLGVKLRSGLSSKNNTAPAHDGMSLAVISALRRWAAACGSCLIHCVPVLQRHASPSWSDIERGCLSLDHLQLHLSQLATTAFAFLMSTSISCFRNIAHASVSKTACACVYVSMPMRGGDGEGEERRVVFPHPLALTHCTLLTDTHRNTKSTHARAKKINLFQRLTTDTKSHTLHSWYWLFVYVSRDVGAVSADGGDKERKNDQQLLPCH